MLRTCFCYRRSWRWSPFCSESPVLIRVPNSGQSQEPCGTWHTRARSAWHSARLVFHHCIDGVPIVWKGKRCTGEIWTSLDCFKGWKCLNTCVYHHSVGGSLEWRKEKSHACGVAENSYLGHQTLAQVNNVFPSEFIWYQCFIRWSFVPESSWGLRM